MNVRERIITAFERDKTPDRVPSFFESIMDIFKDNFFKEYEDDIEEEHELFGPWGDYTIYKFYGVDSVWLHSEPIKMAKLPIDFKSIKLKKENYKLNRWGNISAETTVMGRKHSYYLDGYLKTEELWKEWIDLGYFDFEIDNEWIRRWEKNYKELLDRDFMVIPVTTTWEKIREAMGMDRFAYFYRKKKDFLKMLLDKIYKIYEESAKALNDTGFDVVTWADDCAYKNNTMISPKQFEELIVPHYKRLNQISHKQSFTFFHSDGFTEPFFPGLIEAGFNGVQSLEPAAGMDLKHLKETYGDKLTLIGNIDVSRLLSYGSPEDIIKEVKYEIKVAAKDGGYIFSPCTDVIDSIPPKNIKIAMDALHKYGKYPIDFNNL
ncbi:MAG: uroporphyrinogen decarboxylase family protein [Promethearchaeota archaeon]